MFLPFPPLTLPFLIPFFPLSTFYFLSPPFTSPDFLPFPLPYPLSPFLYTSFVPPLSPSLFLFPLTFTTLTQSIENLEYNNCSRWWAWIFVIFVCPMHSSIGQNIKSHAVSDIRSTARVWKTSNGHNSVMRHPIEFVFGSRLGFLARIALFNLTAHELHELYYDRPTS